MKVDGISLNVNQTQMNGTYLHSAVSGVFSKKMSTEETLQSIDGTLKRIEKILLEKQKEETSIRVDVSELAITMARQGLINRLNSRKDDFKN